MNESFNTVPSPEGSLVESGLRSVVSLRKRIYLVVADSSEQDIQEFDIDRQGQLFNELDGTPSDWSFESANRIGNWDRASGITAGRDEEVTLEDARADKFFTYDFGKALVRHVEVLNQSREVSQDESEASEPVESGKVDTSDIDELAKDLGLNDAEKDFFR